MRNLRKSNNALEMPSSTSSSREEEESQSSSDVNLELEKLRTTNLQLAKKNAELQQRLGLMFKENCDLVKEVCSLQIKLKAKNDLAKDLNRKALELSHIAVNFIMAGQGDVSQINHTGPGPSKVNVSVNVSNGHTPNGPPKGSMSPSHQQTRAVKPMISGHTIDRPVINLQRVSQAQLERMSERVRNGIEESDPEIAHVRENISDDIINNNTVPEEENEDPEENESEPIEDEVREEISPSPNQATENFPLNTIMETTEIESPLSTNLQNTPIENISTRITRRRNRNIFISPVSEAIIEPEHESPTPESPTNQRTNFSDESVSCSLTDISNTLTYQGHVTTRRGANKRRNITSVSQNMSSTLSQPSITLNNMDTHINSIEHPGITGEVSNLTDTQFMEDLNHDFATSTPAVNINITKRARISDSHSPKSTITQQTRNSMKRCSVILKRIVEPKRRSSSPKKRRSRRITTESTKSDTASETTEDAGPSTSKTDSPIRKRPGRKGKPKDLKEPSRRNKLRR